MIAFARTFFWLHTVLCVGFVFMALRAGVSAIGSADTVLPGRSRLGSIAVVNDDRAVTGLMYVVLGLFLVYAEIYLYRVYTMANTFLP